MLELSWKLEVGDSLANDLEANLRGVFMPDFLPSYFYFHLYYKVSFYLVADWFVFLETSF